MGYIVHNAIVVTGIDLPAYVPGDTANALTAAHRRAAELGLQPTSIVTRVNSYSSFLIPADGSKEGWQESDDFDKLRDSFVEYLRSLAYGDGSSVVHWVEVQYGGDEPGINTRVTRGYGLRRGTKKKAA